jgi:hypothetical protein
VLSKPRTLLRASSGDTLVSVAPQSHRVHEGGTEDGLKKVTRSKTEFLDRNSAFSYINYPPNALLII